MGNGGCSQFITYCLWWSFLLRGGTPHILFLMKCMVPSMGNSPSQAFPMLVLTRGCSSSWSDSAWVPYTWLMPQQQPASAWAPHGVTNSANKTAPAWAPLSTGPQVLPGRCSSVGCPHSHSLLHAISYTRRGSLHGLRTLIFSTFDLHRLRGNSLPHLGLLQGCRGTSGPVPGASPLSPTWLALVSVGLFFSHVLIFLLAIFHSSFSPSSIGYPWGC